jgi:predicted NAD/FAD-binding protein
MRIAVVGTGIAGLGAAWLLQRQHAVTLYERNDYAGGHSHTLEAMTASGAVPVDTGFMVFNRRNYPLLTGLFRHLGVATQKTDMSFAVSIGNGALEYAGSGLATLFAQPRNWFSATHYRMLAEILRFNREAKAQLQDGAPGNLTLAEFLERGGYSSAFRNRYLLPMAAAIWSCPLQTMAGFPALSLFRFFYNHGLLDIRNRPQWYTVSGGSRRYVQRMLADLEGSILQQRPVLSVERTGNGIAVGDASGERRHFDAVVMAAHADETLQMLANPTAQEQALLSRFSYQPNQVYLHTDTDLMPRRRRVWSSWNYLAREEAGRTQAVSVSYWMNRLQGLHSAAPLFVSLNPLQPPAAASVIAEMTYDHPVFDSGAMQAQQALPGLQGVGGIWYCGSYFGYGFHEDALQSAVTVARHLGVEAPWLKDREPAQDAALQPLPAWAGT